MKTYLVTVSITTEEVLEVKAANEDEAKQKALAGTGKVVDGLETTREILEVNEDDEGADR